MDDPQRPHPTIRTVWILRGLLWGLALLPLGWLPLLPIGYAVYLATPLAILPAYIVGAIILVTIAFSALLLHTMARYNNHGYALEHRGLRIRQGVLHRTDLLIPYEAIQGVAIRRGPLLKRFHLGTLQIRVDPASDLAGDWSEARIEGLDDPEVAAQAILARAAAPQTGAPTALPATLSPTVRPTPQTIPAQRP